MILRDTVIVGGKRYKAHVGSHLVDQEIQEIDLEGNVIVVRQQKEQLRAIVKPNPVHVKGAVYEWRGETYFSRFSPDVHRKHGRDHHYTIKLERVSASA